MALVTGKVLFEGGVESFGTDPMVLRISTPSYDYQLLVTSSFGEGDQRPDAVVTVERITGAPVVRQTTVSAADDAYRVVLPGATFLGSSVKALRVWSNSATWDELSAEISYGVAIRDGSLVAAGAFEALFFTEDPSPPESYFGRDIHSPSHVFLINAAAFREFVAAHPAPSNRTDEYLLRAIRALGVFTAGTSRPAQLTGEELAKLVEQLGTTPDVVAAVQSNWELLTTFPITVPAPKPVQVGGTLQVVASGGEPVTRDEFGTYRVTAEVPIRTLDAEPKPVSFLAEFGALTDPVVMPAAFTMTPERPVSAAATTGPVTVRVRDVDGSVVWRRSYAPDDSVLTHLDISVAALPRGESAPGPEAGPGLRRKIRGQVLPRNSEQKVSGLTVLLQAKEAVEAPLWMVVAAGETDGSGYFSMPYPRGCFVAAQAIVSTAPNSVVDLRIVDDGPADETLADDFLYLLLDPGGVPAAPGSGRPARLPDQADLVQSDEYSQDLGGQCVNVTTPNRTLREYNYNAIVRTSDPDVANYTLRKTRDGSYQLHGGASKLIRRPVDLTNPVRWQDAPAAGDELSFYQAVTVATGHILFFKSVFKADGYSLGDLVYSLPLAPGQKKQIVSYDVANALEARESQETSQAERLTAGLLDDRFITDQLGGGIGESIRGASSASTSGLSGGLGLAGAFGWIGGALGVAGGFANSQSSAIQSAARNITQFFSERLRQSLLQNAESYRRLNASVVTAVREGQEYAVTTEVVANHNHCRSMTMMYFEVLRHYVIQQELADVQEALFVPLLLTEFTPQNITKWKDVLAANLLAMPSHSNLPSALPRSTRPAHPLIRAFDANERIRTNYERVDFPTGSYAEDPLTSITGEISLRVHFPRPRTRADRILSLPIVTEVVRSKRIDTMATTAAAVFTGGLSLLGGASTTTVEQEILVRADLFDRFMDLDDNFQSVPPARAIRVKDFSPQVVTIGSNTATVDFFQNDEDRERWRKYAVILGLGSEHELMNQYFAGRLVSEWTTIFNTDIAPRLYQATLSAIGFEPVGDGAGLNLDLTPTMAYQGGERQITVRAADLGASHPARKDLAPRIRIRIGNDTLREIGSFATVDLQRVLLSYNTAHHRGTIFNGFLRDDLLDATGAELSIPLTPDDLRNPRKEDRYLQQELVDHLNANVEHYNAVLWRNLDPNRRYMLLDGFTIETFTREGTSAGHRSLASVVKNDLVAVLGNSLVFPVADGYHVNRWLVTATESKDDKAENDARNPLLEYYRLTDEIPPYRVSVPTRGVYSEAVLGACDSCEECKPNSSQDWDVFRADEPTTITPVLTPTPQRSDWKALWAQLAAPIVQLQAAPAAPTPAAGLVGLSEALTKSDAFRDLTGLTANQANVIKTYLSNQENAKAFAEMAKTMAVQEHNANNSRSIMRTLETAQKSGAITSDDHRQLVRDHLGQLIDGGARQRAETERENRQEPSLTHAAIEAAGAGRPVTAQRTTTDGEAESMRVGTHRSGAGPFGAGSRPSNVNRGSRPSDAMLAISAFAGRTTGGPWRLSRADVADDLRKLVQNPNGVFQDSLNLCGPAVFLRFWVNRDPLAVVQFAAELFESGRSHIGDYEVEPDEDSLLGQDYAALKAQVEQHGQHGAVDIEDHGPGSRDRRRRFCPPAQWMILGSLRDAENAFFDYEGRPDEDVSAATTPGEVADWLIATGLYRRVRDEGNFFFTKGLDHLTSLAPTAACDVALLINTQLLPRGELVQDQPKVVEFILNAFPDHYIGLESRVQKVPDDKLQISYWTYGEILTKKFPRDVVDANYYGAVIAER